MRNTPSDKSKGYLEQWIDSPHDLRGILVAYTLNELRYGTSETTPLSKNDLMWFLRAALGLRGDCKLSPIKPPAFSS